MNRGFKTRSKWAMALLIGLPLSQAVPTHAAQEHGSDATPAGPETTVTVENVLTAEPETFVGDFAPQLVPGSDGGEITLLPDAAGKHRGLTITRSRDRINVSTGLPDLGEIGKRRITLTREKSDAQEAISALLKEAGASYVIGGELPKGRGVSFSLRDVPLNDAIGAVATAAGLGIRMQGSVIVLTPDLFSSSSAVFGDWPRNAIPGFSAMPKNFTYRFKGEDLSKRSLAPFQKPQTEKMGLYRKQGLLESPPDSRPRTRSN